MTNDGSDDLLDEGYNLEAKFLGIILKLYWEGVIPAKMAAQTTPSKNTIRDYFLALDCVISLLEVSARISEKEIDTLHKDINTASAACFKFKVPTAQPLRSFNYKLSRVIANLNMFTKPGMKVDKVEEPEEEEEVEDAENTKDTKKGNR